MIKILTAAGAIHKGGIIISIGVVLFFLTY